MHRVPAAAEPLLQSDLWVNLMKALAALLLIFGLTAPSACSQELVPKYDLLFEGNYLARIGNNSPEELERALVRIEQYFLADQPEGDYQPVVIVLHGPEVRLFMRDRYQKNKHLVDLAARLSAFDVIDIRVCETRMGVLGQLVSALVPFVSTVPFGPAEVDRLVNEEEYLYF